MIKHDAPGFFAGPMPMPKMTYLDYYRRMEFEKWHEFWTRHGKMMQREMNRCFVDKKTRKKHGV